MKEQISGVESPKNTQGLKTYRGQIEAQRVQYAQKELSKLGHSTRWLPQERCLIFIYKGHRCRFFPYSGWYSVRGVGSGRGIKNLIKELRRRDNESH